MQVKTETRSYPAKDKNGLPTKYRVTYELEFKENLLVNVRNESGFSIEKKSECFEYFSSKFN